MVSTPVNILHANVFGGESLLVMKPGSWSLH